LKLKNSRLSTPVSATSRDGAAFIGRHFGTLLPTAATDQSAKP